MQFHQQFRKRCPKCPKCIKNLEKFQQKVGKEHKKNLFLLTKKLFLPKCHSGHVESISDNSAGNFWLSESLSCNNLIFQYKREKTCLWTIWMQLCPTCQNLSGRQSAKTIFFKKNLAASLPPKTLKLYSFLVIFRLEKPLQTLFAANLNTLFNLYKKISY